MKTERQREMDDFDNKFYLFLTSTIDLNLSQLQGQYLAYIMGILAICMTSFLLLTLIISMISCIYRRPEPLEETPKMKAKRILAALKRENLSLSWHEERIAANIILPTDLNVSWSDVAGLDDVIRNLKKDVINPLIAEKNVREKSRVITCPKGVLLHGPPGCGKTLLAKAIAKEVKCCFMNIDVSCIFDAFLGESEKMTKAIFTLAEKIQPCIIFIDEIESLLKSRSIGDHEVSSRMKTQFMSLWDGLITDASKTIIILGATNKPAEIDKAILRRMPTKIKIPLPSLEQRTNVISLLLKTEELHENVDMQNLAELTEGFSCSDLKDIVRVTGINCLNDGYTITPEILDFLMESSKKPTDNDIVANQLDKVNNVFWLKRRLPLIKELLTKKDKGNLPIVDVRPLSMDDFKYAIKRAKEAKSAAENNWA